MTGTGLQAEYGVKRIADQLHGLLRRYLEAQYHIRDVGLIEERRALLQEHGTIGQRPFLETTPSYEIAERYAKLRLPAVVSETLSELAGWNPGVGVFPKPYTHQAQALVSFLTERRDLVVATGTGSGKTESFLFPILGQLLVEGSERKKSFHRPGFRALLLYPMNALVSDQLARLRKLFGDARLRDLFQSRYGKFPRFGMYTSRTPYPGPRTSAKDRKNLLSFLQYYLDLENPPSSLPTDEQENRRRLRLELIERGRWPAKDLAAFFGQDGGRWHSRLKTQPGDRELLTRDEIQEQCPEILVTNYSMLEYMLLRPIERSIFRQTADWLASDENNAVTLVLDEAHMYRGAGGAEVALLIRRLQARLGVTRDRVRCILTSASLGSGEEAKAAVKTFAVGLTGHPANDKMPFELIQGRREARPLARDGSAQEAEQLATFNLPAFFQMAESPAGAGQAIAELASCSKWPEPPAYPLQGNVDDVHRYERDVRAYLYQQLFGTGPIELLIAQTSGSAQEFGRLAATLFPHSERETAELAASVLLALGTYAHDGERPLLPTRVHLMFRGLPSLHACINPRCTVRRYRPGEELLLGRLYTEPRANCTCDLHARVYELYTHRDCGAAFLRVFGRGPLPHFYWHEQGGDLENVGQPLDPDYLLIERPHSKMLKDIQPAWVEISTGRVESQPPKDQSRYRQVYRAQQRPNSNGSQSDPGFRSCPACTRQSGNKIMDLATKGEQPFANLVREQLVLQPAKREPSEAYPNGGRKVLLFSDGRQKAARLARDLPREVEFDSFRQALVLAVSRLEGVNREALLDERLYASFISVCSSFNLHFFDRVGRSQEALLAEIKRFHDYYDADLSLALDEEWRPSPPPRYGQALLRQLCDPFYSLYSACAAVAQPSKQAFRLLQRQLSFLQAGFLDQHLSSIARFWIEAILDRTAFDPKLNEDSRRRVNEFFRPIQWNERIARFENLLRDYAGLSESQVESLRERLYDVLADRDTHGGAYLKPSALVLKLAIDDIWLQCASCGLTQYGYLIGRCASCGSDQLSERPVDHPYMTSRKGYFREPLRAVLAGERPIHITAEEHTAQLSQRDAGVVYATTEEYELRFQDVPLGLDKPPVDVLSCTTTMEVGIDIGSLTAVGLRNVPPQRENYQQRSGRAGRRGSAVSTVLTYAQGGPHDNYYYETPREIISGEPRIPKVKVDNRRLARRHIHSFLIQTFFHHQLDSLSPEEEKDLADRTNLISALGSVAEFFTTSGIFSMDQFSAWAESNVVNSEQRLANEIARWLPDELCISPSSDEDRLNEKRSFAVQVTRDLLKGLRELRDTYVSSAIANVQTVDGKNEESGTGLLLDLLFDRGLLPTYAFPTDLCTFYVFETDNGNVRIKERPQQSKDKALSEYAPGRLIVVNKETYRIGGIYVEGTGSASPATGLFSRPLGKYVYCPLCTYIRDVPLRREDETCPVCETPLRERELLDPPGFSPERGRPLDERDREQEISYATSAQFPTPIESDRFQWKQNAGTHIRHAYEQDRKLVIVNKGPGESGFKVCEACGAAKPDTEPWPAGPHPRPFLVPNYVLQREGVSWLCNGAIRKNPIYLGHSFLTDILLLRISFCLPLKYDPRHPWLQDALRTTAEALSLGASRQLDIDAGELSAGFRLMPAVSGGDPSALGLADIYLFDTAAGGAGYAAEAGDLIVRVLQRTLDLLRECPENCERSCTKCLRHYGNRYWHERLDRHLAAELVTYAQCGTAPSIGSIAKQCTDLIPLQRYLELEGWSSSLDSNIHDVQVPLLVRDNAQGNWVAIGTYPALLDKDASSFDHPLYALDGEDDVAVSLLADYVVSRDLPTAYQQFRKDARQQ